MEKSDFIAWASKLQHNYKPSQSVINRIASIEMIAIVGPTGVGKSTIIESLDIPVVLSTVSREKRPGEKDKRSYRFAHDYLKIIDEIKQGNFVQFLVSESGEFYGTHIDDYPRSGKCLMAIFANAINHFKSIGFKQVIQIYIMPPSYVEWMRRIGGVRTKDLLIRISEARNSILLALEDEKYHFVLNDDLNLALQDIRRVLDNEEIDAHRTELAVGTADILLEHIGEQVV
jgi:guanylate kinase